MADPLAGNSVGLDRRRRRRQETIDEILDIAVQVMAEEGVAGLSLSEVARRMGIQPPSLYKYFPLRSPSTMPYFFVRPARCWKPSALPPPKPSQGGRP